MTIKEYLENIWKTEFIEKWSEFVRQPNPQNILNQVQLWEKAKEIWDEKIIEEAKKIIKEATVKMWFLHYSLLKITPTCKIKINTCESNEDFYNYLRWRNKYLFASLTDDCLYPDETDKTKEMLEIYLENRNILIKNWNVWDKNVQLSSYTKIQQKLIDISINNLIETTNKVSKNSSKIAKIALRVAWITGIWWLILWSLSYFWSLKGEKENLNNLTWIYFEVQNMWNIVEWFSWKYNQESIENIIKEQTLILKNIENIYNKLK